MLRVRSAFFKTTTEILYILVNSVKRQNGLIRRKIRSVCELYYARNEEQDQRVINLESGSTDVIQVNDEVLYLENNRKESIY
jgi:hypothetical protein